MTYEIKITEVSEGAECSGVQIVACQMNANSDEAAAQVMNDLLRSVSASNTIPIDRLNTNLYKTQWINGI